MRRSKRNKTPAISTESKFVENLGKFEVRVVSKDVGRGVFAREMISKGEFLMIYNGLVLNCEPSSEKDDYIFEFGHKGKTYWVDASVDDGSYGRLLNDNHINPNCYPKVIEVNSKPHIGFFARRAVNSGEELRYCYGGKHSCYPWRHDRKKSSCQEDIEWKSGKNKRTDCLQQQTSHADETSPDVSPDGLQQQTSRADVASDVSPDGLQQQTSHPDETSPDVSPDGLQQQTSHAYVASPDVSPDGLQQQKSHADETSPDVSPDGLQQQTSHADVTSPDVSPDGLQQQTSHADETSPDVSPDGLQQQTSHADVTSPDVSPDGLQQQTSHADETSPNVSPDGLQQQTSHAEVTSPDVSPDGLQQQTSHADETSPDVSPDGSQQQTFHTNVTSPDVLPNSLQQQTSHADETSPNVSPDGLQQQTSPADVTSPDVSPDGLQQQTSHADVTSDVSLDDLQLQTACADVTSPDVSPDGLQQQESPADVASPNVSPDVLQQQTSHADVTSPDVSPDGLQQQTSHADVTSPDVSPDGLQQQTSHADETSPDVSPDGLQQQTSHADVTSPDVSPDGLQQQTSHADVTSDVSPDDLQLRTACADVISPDVSPDSLQQQTSHVEETSPNVSPDGLQQQTLHADVTSPDVSPDGLQQKESPADVTSLDVLPDGLQQQTFHADVTSNVSLGGLLQQESPADVTSPDVSPDGLQQQTLHADVTLPDVSLDGLQQQESPAGVTSPDVSPDSLQKQTSHADVISPVVLPYGLQKHTSHANVTFDVSPDDLQLQTAYSDVSPESLQQQTSYADVTSPDVSPDGLQQQTFHTNVTYPDVSPDGLQQQTSHADVTPPDVSPDGLQQQISHADVTSPDVAPDGLQQQTSHADVTSDVSPDGLQQQTSHADVTSDVSPDDLQLQTVDADVTSPDVSHDSLQQQTSHADVTSDVSPDDLQQQTSHADVTSPDVSPDSLQLQTSHADVTSDVSPDDLQQQTSHADVTSPDVSPDSLQLQTSCADVTSSDVSPDDDLQVQTADADVSLLSAYSAEDPQLENVIVYKADVSSVAPAPVISIDGFLSLEHDCSFEDIDDHDPTYVPDEEDVSDSDESTSDLSDIYPALSENSRKMVIKGHKRPPETAQTAQKRQKNEEQTTSSSCLASVDLQTSVQPHKRPTSELDEMLSPPKRTKILDPNTDSSNTSGKSAIVVATTHNEGTRRIFDKRNACLYCGELQTNISRHLRRKHKSEAEVAKAEGFKVKSEMRADQFNRIRHLGNFYHNVKVKDIGEGLFIVAKRPPKDVHVPYDRYVPCVFCKGYYISTDIWRHYQDCPCSDDLTVDKEECKTITAVGNLRASRILGEKSKYQESDAEGMAALFATMKLDDTSIICKTDEIICKLGMQLYHKQGMENLTHIRAKLREMARLLLNIRKTSEEQLSLGDLLRPEMFDKVLEGVKAECKYSMDNGTPTFEIPSLALKMGHSIRKCCYIKQSLCIKSRDEQGEKEVEQFLKLLPMEFTDKVSSIALRTLHIAKQRKSTVLPLTSDVVTFQSFIKDKVSSLQQEIQEQHSDITVFQYLAKATLSRVMTFNKRRSGEIAKAKLQDFVDRNKKDEPGTEDIFNMLSTTERKLASRLQLMHIRGKRGRVVPTILTKDMMAPLELLVDKSIREKVGISSGNTYIFPMGRGSNGNIRGCDALSQMVAEAGLQEPASFKSNPLRKYIATVSQVLNMDENEFDWLASHLGHDVRVHRSFYRLQSKHVELAKVAKLLITVDKGQAHTLLGKKIDDIEVAELDDVQDEEEGEEEEEEGEKDIAENRRIANAEDEFEDGVGDDEPVKDGVAKDAVASVEDGEEVEKDEKQKHDTSSRRNLGSRKMIPHTAWTKAEKTFMYEEFGEVLRKTTIAGVGAKRCIEAIKKSNGVLNNRTVTQVKSWVSTRVRKNRLSAHI